MIPETSRVRQPKISLPHGGALPMTTGAAPITTSIGAITIGALAGAWGWPHDRGHIWEAVSPHSSYSFHGPENECGGPKFEQGKLVPKHGYTLGVVSDGTPLKFAPLLIIELDQLQLG